MTERPPEPGPPESPPPGPIASRLARARASFAQALRALLRPQGLPPEAASELAAAFGDAGREVFSGGRGRLGRLRTELRAAPPR
ncbi:MAG TPA: hypothetical protein VHW93_09720, partial [Acidimicrobiales bacterium]|nr:hypothetical protein [Acidimicrobiales bacterium]